MVYLHVPFCESFCTYCGFFSTVIPSEAKNRCFETFADAVCAEIESRRDEIAATSSLNTLYVGGGTPSVLPLGILSRIVSALRPVLPSANQLFWKEFTLEVNPEDIVEKGEDYVKGLMALGINRISMGIQSFDDGILRWMNRRHDSAAAIKAFGILRRCGMDNISIDLIFGLPQLSESIWNSTIEQALALGPEHISAYQLSIEEDSTLERLLSEGKFTEAPEEQCRSQYDLLCRKLNEAGYSHYEISNFALPGKEAVHNSAYWRRVPYVGLGPGAHSLSAKGIRSWNTQDVSAYSREEEILSPENIRIERIMLPLRTSHGMPESELRSLAGDHIVDSLISERFLVRCHSGEESIRIPEDHFFVSDEIIRELV
ncbi:MAG: radical SAM family heme chaperone HemW [Bacteroidales bacterium]|nr:radical SAM family heme chaperone HemW [Bacteroidales bacterium]